MKEACEDAKKSVMEEADERWRIVLREHLDKARGEASEAAAAASREHDALLNETQQAFRMYEFSLVWQNTPTVNSWRICDGSQAITLSDLLSEP